MAIMGGQQHQLSIADLLIADLFLKQSKCYVAENSTPLVGFLGTSIRYRML